MERLDSKVSSREVRNSNSSRLDQATRAPDAPVELEQQQGVLEFRNTEAALAAELVKGPIAAPSDDAKQASGGLVRQPKVGRGFTGGGFIGVRIVDGGAEGGSICAGGRAASASLATASRASASDRDVAARWRSPSRARSSRAQASDDSVNVTRSASRAIRSVRACASAAPPSCGSSSAPPSTAPATRLSSERMSRLRARSSHSDSVSGRATRVTSRTRE
jgi:hypothetical protein